MLNQTVLVGRVHKIETKKLTDKKKKEVELSLIVQRTFKNEDGVYDEDIIPVVMKDVVAEKTTEYIHETDVVGIKGRLQFENDKLEVFAEKVTFLTSSKSEAE